MIAPLRETSSGRKHTSMSLLIDDGSIETHIQSGVNKINWYFLISSLKPVHLCFCCGFICCLKLSSQQLYVFFSELWFSLSLLFVPKSDRDPELTLLPGTSCCQSLANVKPLVVSGPTAPWRTFWVLVSIRLRRLKSRPLYQFSWHMRTLMSILMPFVIMVYFAEVRNTEY